MSDAKLYEKNILLSGKLVTAVDGASIGNNFQALTNMRYTDTNPRAVQGMSKINTTAPTTYLKIRNGFHFRKADESHVLVQAYNAGLTASQVLQNTTAIPNQGDFSATALHTDSAGAVTGSFVSAPLGNMVYCNGVDTMIWGGNEYYCAGFIVFDPDGSFEYDFFDIISNTLTDSDNVATFSAGIGGLDSNVMLLLSLDNNVTDTSPATPHTVTNNNVTFDGTTKVFGTHSGLFTTNAYLSIPDNADFDLSSGIFTIDTRARLTSLAANNVLYYQATDVNNYIKLYVDTSGAVVLSIYDTGAETVALSTANIITVNEWYHIEWAENGDDFYIFVDGIRRAYVSNTNRASDYVGNPVQIGYDGVSYAEFRLDEYRVSNVARHTSAFQILTIPYGSSAYYFYIGSTRPLQGFKLYSGTANAAAGTMTVEYWNGSTWTSCTNVVDGTSSGGASLAQTGDVTFDDTKSVAKIKIISGRALYWYRTTITALDAGTSVYKATVDASFQTIKDVWDGQPITCLSFQIFDSLTYSDNTSAVFEADYSSLNTATFANLSGLTTGQEYLLAGFDSQQMGISISLAPGSGNTTADTILTVYRWTGSDWVSVGSIDDQTIENNASLGKSGTITWNADIAEYKTIPVSDVPTKKSSKPPLISFGGGKLSYEDQSVSGVTAFYYYKLEFSKTLSGNVKIDVLTGIPAADDILGYKFAFEAQSRVFLCSATQDRKNSARCSARGAPDVYNGDETIEFEFGDTTELTAGTSLYSLLGADIYDVIIFFKGHETWVVTGAGPDNWIKYRASHEIGCIAPLTLKTVDVTSGSATRNVAIFQASNGIYMFDSREMILISSDIADIFDQAKDTAINPDKIADSVGFLDVANQEYHWLYAEGSSTTLNKEKVLDLKRLRWFDIDRGTDLQAAIEVKDTDGNNYVYGAIDTGYLERLENGTTFDGTSITATLHTGDLSLTESLFNETIIRRIKLTTTAKTTSNSTGAGTHYGDSNTSGSSFTFSHTNASGRLASTVKGQKWGPHTFHSIKLAMTTDDETIGFEPVFLSVIYKIARIDAG